jgi:hypothetical protein
MLLDNEATLLDYTCDYSEGSANLSLPQALHHTDARRGKTRLALMRDKDHEREIQSLLRYHVLR